METIFQTNDVKITHDWRVGNGAANPYYIIEFNINEEQFEIRNEFWNTLVFNHKLKYHNRCDDPNCWLHKTTHSHYSINYWISPNAINVPDPTNLDISDYIPFKIDLPPIDITGKQIGVDVRVEVIPILNI